MWSFGCAIQCRTPIDNETQKIYGLEYHVQWLDSPKYSANAQLACLTRGYVCIRLFLNGFAVNILRLTIRTCHVHAPRACVRARVCESVLD
jgi:hypothetical protein